MEQPQKESQLQHTGKKEGEILQMEDAYFVDEEVEDSSGASVIKNINDACLVVLSIFILTPLLAAIVMVGIGFFSSALFSVDSPQGTDYWVFFYFIYIIINYAVFLGFFFLERTYFSPFGHRPMKGLIFMVLLRNVFIIGNVIPVIYFVPMMTVVYIAILYILLYAVLVVMSVSNRTEV